MLSGQVATLHIQKPFDALLLVAYNSLQMPRAGDELVHRDAARGAATGQPGLRISGQ